MFLRLPAIVLRRMRWAIVQAGLTWDPEPAAIQRQSLAVPGGQAEERCQIWARPLSIHVCLAGAGLPVEQDPDKRGTLVDVDLTAEITVVLPEGPAGSVRQDHRQRPNADPFCRPKGHAPGHPLQQRPGGTRRPSDRCPVAHRLTSPCRWKGNPRRQR